MIKNDKKRIRKLLPCPFIYVEQIEKWLNEMALDGYELVKIKTWYAVFKISERRDIKYHIHFCTENNEEENILIEKGYKFLPHSKTSIRLRRRRLDEIRVYTIDSKLDCIIEDNDVKKKAVIQNIRSIIYPLIDIVVVYMVIFHWLPELSYDEWNSEFLVLFSCFMIPFILLAIIKVLSSLKRRSLIKYHKGKAPLPRPPKKLTYRISSATNFLINLIIIVNFIMIAISVTCDVIDTSKTDDILTIKAIEGEYSSYLPSEQLDEYEDTHIFRTVVMPKFYYLYDDVTTNENESDDSIYYCVEYARYNIKKLADISYDRWFSVREVHYKYAEIKNYAVTYYKDLEDDILYLILKNDYEVIDIIYSGNRTPTEVIENIEENFSKRQN